MASASSPTAKVRIIASSLAFPEGPVALPDGSVLVTEIAAGTLARVSPNGRIERIAHLGGGPNGAAIEPDGAVYVCNNGGSFSFHRQGDLLVFGMVAPPSYSGGSIDRVNLATGEVTTLYRACGDRPLRGPNDLVFDQTGGFWFTDHGIRSDRSSDRTGVFYAQPTGPASPKRSSRSTPRMASPCRRTAVVSTWPKHRSGGSGIWTLMVPARSQATRIASFTRGSFSTVHRAMRCSTR
jgi:sugar lactone lactonase YvrE